jgi:serine protease Do
VKLDETSDKSVRRAESDSQDNDKAALGVSVAPITPDLASRFNLPRTAKGVLVQDVNPDGRAADAGIQAGDLIEQVNRTPVTTVDELRNAVRRSTDRPLLLLVNREGRSLFVTVKP